MTSEATETTRLLDSILGVLSRAFGEDLTSIPADTSFFDLGADSLLMINALREIEQEHHVKVTMRELFDETGTPRLLAELVAARLAGRPGTTPLPATAQPPLHPCRSRTRRSRPPQVRRPRPPRSRPPPPRSRSPTRRYPGSAPRRPPRHAAGPVRRRGRRSRHPAGAAGTGRTGAAVVTDPAPDADPALPDLRAARAPERRDGGPAERRGGPVTEQQSLTAALDRDLAAMAGLSRRITERIDAGRAMTGPAPQPQAHGPRVVIAPDAGMVRATSPRTQQEHLDDLVRRYTARTAASKQLARRHRRRLADSRAVVGFRRSTKEMLYPVAARRADGARIEDIDGNSYTDITMGFGVLLFGHEPGFVRDAVREHLSRGIRLGPAASRRARRPSCSAN